tara:strand:+ start:3682 stop:3912 length:231 start_codon:yes stop_codon:yes gene_type:complete
MNKNIIIEETKSDIEEESNYQNDHEINDYNEEIKLTDEKIELLSANYSERILYYMFYPKYFLEVLWESITTLRWKL